MKTKLYTLVFFAFSTLHSVVSKAQTNYSITTNKSWSAVLPSTCANCKIVIGTDATLTIDQSVTCQNCSFQGGTMTMTDKTLNIQYTGNSVVTTNFSNIKFQVSGDNGKVIVNAPLSLNGASFIFSNASYFNTSYQVDLVSSTVSLNDNATMYSTGGPASPISLSGASKIIVGNGTRTSAAALTVSGPSVVLYDVSQIIVGNNNNVYYNWANYNASPAKSTNAATSKSYSTSSSTINCGGKGQHLCSNPSLYGPATLTTNGVLPGNALPVVLTDFAALSNGDGTATLTWETKMEQNASRFEIERSADGTGWATIGTVQAQGNTSMPTGYSYTDSRMLTGTNYYRMKMIDLDGSSVYSEVRVLQVNASARLSFFPNPARDYVNITLGGISSTNVKVRLISQAGVVVLEKNVAGGAGTTVTLPLQQLTSGWYVLHLTTAEGVHETSKLMINRQ